MFGDGVAGTQMGLVPGSGPEDAISGEALFFCTARSSDG